MSNKIPRSNDNDYSPEIIAERQQFLEERTGATLEHTRQFSFDPASMDGNCEHLFGVAQVPIGVAGPLLVDGEHAKGEFYVPLATIEGTLIADLAQAGVDHNINQYLFDVRGSHNIKSPFHDYQIAHHHLRGLGYNQVSKIAFLVKEGDTSHDFFQITAANAGYYQCRR